MQSHVEPLGYSVVRSFVGHGIGQAMHEDPPVPNYGSPDRGLRLSPGLVLAIEPMVNVGSPEVKTLADAGPLSPTMVVCPPTSSTPSRSPSKDRSF